MLIKGTSASCKIINTKISKAKAYLTVVISSTTPAEVNKYYRFYLKEDTELKLLSNNNYWIDRNNNYNNESNNIDVNMYKEIVLEIDLTNNNNGHMIGRRWVRNCQLVLVDEDQNKSQAWISEDLHLISQEIELPRISEIDIYSSDNFNKLHLKLKYAYTSQSDFSYNNENLFTRITLRSNATQEILDQVNVYEEDAINSTITYTFEEVYDSYIDVLIELCNMAGDPLIVYKRLYKPYIKRFKTYVKQNGQVKEVKTIHVQRPENIALHGMDVKISDVLHPTINKIQNLLYNITRNDREENLPYHYVEVYVRDIFFTTVQDESLNLDEFGEYIPGDDTNPLKISLKAFRLLGSYKKYSKTEVVIYDYNKNCGYTQFCSADNVVRF